MANTISQLYEAVTTSEIANLEIGGKSRYLQIPIQTQFAYLPSLTERVFTGTYLTTSTPFEQAYLDHGHNIARYALLLLEDAESIIRNIRLDHNDSVAAMIRSMSPTVSISQVADLNRARVEDVLKIAHNLIYWRKARTINPVHHRNTYIVSPLGPIANLYHFSSLFRAKFPLLPSLPRILSTLSTGIPTAYYNMIPTRDHRELYLDAMGWMLKYGFVTQLRRFVWIKITTRIKDLVNKDIQIEEARRNYELEQSYKPAVQTQDYASNTAHGETLTFTKTAVSPTLQSVATHGTSILKKAISSPQSLPVESTLEASVNERQRNRSDPRVSLNPVADMAEEGNCDKEHKTSEHSTSAAIAVHRPPSVRVDMHSHQLPSHVHLSTSLNPRLGTSMLGPGHSSLMPMSQPNFVSSSLASSLGIKRSAFAVTPSESELGSIPTGGDGTTASGAGGIGGSGTSSGDDRLEDTILLDPCSATALQMKWINKLLEKKPSTLVAMFWKLFKFMDGKHAIDEVEGVTRVEVKKVLEAFGDNLVIARHW